MKKEIDITDPKVVAQHVKAMLMTPGWQIVMQYLNLDRENIISTGIKSRANEKAIKTWASLEGFDTAVKRIVSLSKVADDLPEDIEDNDNE